MFDADLSAVASSLVTLNLSYNSLVGVAGLEPLSCLTVLCLHGNDLVEIPSVVSALESLQRLGLSSNSIREVSPDLASLTNLEGRSPWMGSTQLCSLSKRQNTPPNALCSPRPIGHHLPSVTRAVPGGQSAEAIFVSGGGCPDAIDGAATGRQCRA